MIQLPSLASFVLGKGGVGDKSAKQVLYHYKLHLDSQKHALEAHAFQRRYAATLQGVEPRRDGGQLGA